MADDPKPAADSKTGEVASEDALVQVQGLRARLGHTSVALEESNRRLAGAQATAEAALETAAAARAEVAAATARTQTNADLDRARDDLSAAEREVEEAFTASDGKALAAAQAKVGRLGARVERLEEADRVAKAPPQQRPNGGRVNQPNPRIQELAQSNWVGANGSERELFMSGRTAPTAAWLRTHPEFFDDRKVNARVRAADTEWEAEGKPKDTPEYFDFIEQKAGLVEAPARTQTEDPPARTAAGSAGTAAALTPAGGTAAAAEPTEKTPRAGQRRVAPVAAPPTRSGAPNLSGKGGTTGEMRITPEMQRWAEICGVDPAEYYAEHQRLLGEGEIQDRFGRGLTPNI